MKFSAVAFDLDGTLYPDLRLYIRLVPFLLKEMRLLLAMGRARKMLRETAPGDSELNESNKSNTGDFYEKQAQIIAEILNKPVDKIREKIDRLIYKGWEEYFKKIKLFPHVRETLDKFREKDIKLGMLSDFPPENKLEYLGLSGYWDVIACSEVSGKLKPDPLSFLEVAGKLGTEADQVLYVGNRHSYDVAGAHRAGMKTALIQSRFIKKPKNPVPDFVFHDYRQLQKYVLG